MNAMICNVCGRHIHYCECEDNTRRKSPLKTKSKITKRKKRKYCVYCKRLMGSSTNKYGEKDVHKKCERDYVTRIKGLLYWYRNTFCDNSCIAIIYFLV